MAKGPLAAAALVLAAMAIIGLIDQFVRVIAAQSSLWTFHVLRSAMIAALAGAWVVLSGARPRVVSWRGVAGRSALMSTALVIYFGALGFVPVAQAAAGLYSAPLWVAALSGVAFGRRVGPVRGAAAVAGFAGVVLVLAPDPSAMGWGTALPVVAGAFYGLGALSTRAWCAEEQALVLALGGFAGQAVWGLGGMALASAVDLGGGFLGQGWVAPTGEVLAWTAVQAVGSLVAVVLLSRAYLIAEASVVSVLEYSLLAFSAGFGILLWGDRLGPAGLAGLALIALAGSTIALRSPPPPG